MDYISSCDLLVKAARTEAKRQAERRALKEDELWKSIDSTLNAISNLGVIGQSRPVKYISPANGQPYPNPQFQKWVTEVYNAKARVNDKLHEVLLQRSELYNMAETAVKRVIITGGVTKTKTSVLDAMDNEIVLVMQMLKQTYDKVVAETDTS